MNPLLSFAFNLNNLRPHTEVYSVPSAQSDWPEPVGRLVGGRLHVPPKHEDLFKGLDAYLKREQIHLKAGAGGAHYLSSQLNPRCAYPSL